MKNDELRKLSDLIDILRGENGCPWDREQKAGEEVYELQWAHAEDKKENVFEELGDVVFVLVFALKLLQEDYPEFTLARITSLVHDKIERRHPHVFGDAVAQTKAEGLAHWNRMKEQEKRSTGEHVFSGLPGNLPPMRRAEKIQRRAARTGFDWPDTTGIIQKIREETDELEAVLRDDERALSEGELGDLFFSVINLSRFLNMDAEKALSRTNAKFIERFLAMEKLAAADGHPLSAMNLDEMDSYWERAKRDE
jgi:tetrapyrrole methylase family protein/MazG family protein